MREYEYTIILEAEQEGIYTVSVPALPGCFTQGKTIDEAIERAQEAITGYIQTLVQLGEPVPEERQHAMAVVVKVAA
ncbi:MAG: type II toxin-antitoxin system HicB family antitoxin [Chloroflexi bacterium]|nr:type II toxin-antitoxin system HicB family antitoxin [Chloroflexota bacterium]